MLQKRFPEVCRVIGETGKFFDIVLPIPQIIPEKWSEEFEKNQLVVKVGDSHLVFRPYIEDKIKVGLDSQISFSEKERWQSQMKNIGYDCFNFSTFGAVLASDKVFDLITAGEEQAEVEEAEEQRPLPAKVKKCPNCQHKLSKSEVENGVCDECDESFWECPRCHVLTNDDPDDVETCPSCGKTYAKIECPECGEDIWADEVKCPECGKDLVLSKCPDCAKLLIVSDNLDECPYCGETLYICPRCHQYINEDPDDSNDSCPLCHKTLIVIDCPNCGESIPPDSEECPNCHIKFKLGRCPNDDCGKAIIISEDINECPYCESTIQHVVCPHCAQGFYVEPNQ